MVKQCPGSMTSGSLLPVSPISPLYHCITPGIGVVDPNPGRESNLRLCSIHGFWWKLRPIPWPENCELTENPCRFAKSLMECRSAIIDLQ